MADEATTQAAPEAPAPVATPEAQQGDPPQSAAGLTQADIDRAVTNARKAWEAKQSEAATAAKEAEERKKLEEAGKFDELKARLEAEKQQAEAQLKAERIRMRLEVAAVKEGIIDPSDLVALKVDASELLAEDGSVNEEAVKAAVASLKQSKPYFFASTDSEAKPVAKGTASPGSATPAAFDLLAHISPEQHQRAQEANLAKKRDLGRGPDIGNLLMSALGRKA